MNWGNVCFGFLVGCGAAIIGCATLIVVVMTIKLLLHGVC